MSKFRKDNSKSTPGISTASPTRYRIYAIILLYGNNSNARNHYYGKQSMPDATEIKKLEKKSLVSYIYIGAPVERMQGTYGTKSAYSIKRCFCYCR